MKSTLDTPSHTSLHPMVPEPWCVRRLWWETDDTFTFELTPENGRTKFHFLPGQFNMLYVFGVGEVPISVSGDPAKAERLMHTVRAVGPVTRAMGSLKRGTQLGVRGPFGTCWPMEQAVGKDILILAGGIGLAPLRPVVYEVLAKRQIFGRVYLLYGARTPDDILYTQELPELMKEAKLQALVTVDRAGRDWTGNVGVVTTLIAKAQFDPGNSLAMVCGPEVMMRFTLRELQKRGMRTDSVYISMERNMKCAVGFCGHCQFGPTFICKDGPVFRYDQIQHLLAIREV
ncbi:MAG TPA: FAD/NAD(P)-binding protein [Terriglobales bacterium]|nr:FAD/NAD(P)-binding protein [Terriglobales bacterium]